MKQALIKKGKVYAEEVPAPVVEEGYVLKFKNLADKRLREFVNLADKMAEKYLVQRDEFSHEWIEKKVIVSESIMLIYEYVNEILIRKFDQKEDIRFYAFYLDLIISKLKHSIFTEIPKTEIFDIHPLLVRDIAYTAQRLSIENDLYFFNVDFQRLVFKLFLMYDFVFYKDYGIFTKFKLNKKLFMKVQKVFSLDDADSDGLAFRDFGMNLPMKLIKEFLKFYGYNEVENPYKKLIDLARENKVILFEPFSYYLAYKIWKFAKIIQSTPEFANKEELDRERGNFKELIKGYISENINTISKFYDGKIDNLDLFYTFYELDKKVIKNNLLEKVLLPYLIVTRKEAPSKMFPELKPSFFTHKSDLKRIVEKLIKNDEYEKFKFERLLEDNKVSWKDIAFLVEKMKRKKEIFCSEDGYSLIGVLRGGVLLAHMFNISEGLRNFVYLFSSFPYLSLLPRSEIELKTTYLIIDESIKSGFTLNVFNLYMKRLLNYHGIKDFKYLLISIADFEDFGEKANFVYKTLVKIKVKNKELCVISKSGEEELKIFDWKKFFTNLSTKGIVSIEELKIEKGKRLDVTRLLKDSIKYFQIGKFFAEKLEEINKNQIILYSPTYEGKIICDAIAFVYKVLYGDKELILSKEKALQMGAENTIFVDMTVDTMTTLKRASRIDFGGKEFFKVFTILASDEAIKNLKNLIYITKLRG